MEVESGFGVVVEMADDPRWGAAVTNVAQFQHTLCLNYLLSLSAWFVAAPGTGRHDWLLISAWMSEATPPKENSLEVNYTYDCWARVPSSSNSPNTTNTPSREMLMAES